MLDSDYSFVLKYIEYLLTIGFNVDQYDTTSKTAIITAVLSYESTTITIDEDFSNNEILVKVINKDSASNPSTPTPSPTEFPYVFSMTDSIIEQALTYGRYTDIFNITRSQADNYNIYPSNPDETIAHETLSNLTQVMVLTPTVYIQRAAAMATAKYETYTLAEAKNYYNLCLSAQSIAFELIIPEAEYSTQSIVSIGVFQDGKKIENAVISGLTGFPERSSRWPDNFAYQRIVNLTFNQSSIDITKNVQLKINYVGVAELIYNANLIQYSEMKYLFQ